MDLQSFIAQLVEKNGGEIAGRVRLQNRDLEITATAFFIDRQQKVLFGCHDQDIVIEKVTHAKGNRFSEDEINASYQRVIQKWLPLVKKYAVNQ